MIGRLGPTCSLLALWCLVAAGCAELTDRPIEETTAVASPAATAATPSAAEDGTTPNATAPTAQSAALDSTEAPALAAGPEAAPPAISADEVSPGEAGRPPAARAAPAAEGSRASPVLGASSDASPASADALDFTSLVTRLRETKAIGLLTKVAVKNESDDLLERFRAYHAQHGTTTLAELRQAYDLLLGKLHSLLRDTDPPLDRDIDRSRTAIWEILADPRKFSASHLMTGA